MKERIKDLWRGNIDPQSDGILTTPETTQIMGFIHRHRDALYKTLTDEQQEIFEKLDDCWAEYNHLIEEASKAIHIFFCVILKSYASPPPLIFT